MTQTKDGKLQFGGKCAFALSVGKTDVAGLENLTLTKDGKKYYFSNPVAKFLFKLLPGTLDKAKTSWDGIK